MSLWIDKYRPTQLGKLDYHQDQAATLKRLVQSGDFPHLLVFGPSGAGKKTRIMCILRELYGAGVEKRRIEHKTFDAPSGKRLEITAIASNYHIELNPSDVGFYDRVVIQEVIKTMAQTVQLDAATQKDFKVVVLSQVDCLTKDAQHALRRTMEKYSATCRLILCCQSCSRLIPALRSRCLLLRVAAPTDDQIISILNFVCRKEGLQLPEELAKRLAAKSEGNLRRALLMCEATRVQQYPFVPDQVISEPDWQVYIRDTAALILQEQTPQRLLEVRKRFYELLSHCIPPNVIFKTLLTELINSADVTLKAQITADAAMYEHRLELGTKAIFHIEAFVAKFMSLYKKFLDGIMLCD